MYSGTWYHVVPYRYTLSCRFSFFDDLFIYSGTIYRIDTPYRYDLIYRAIYTLIDTRYTVSIQSIDTYSMVYRLYQSISTPVMSFYSIRYHIPYRYTLSIRSNISRRIYFDRYTVSIQSIDTYSMVYRLYQSISTPVMSFYSITPLSCGSVRSNKNHKHEVYRWVIGNAVFVSSCLTGRSILFLLSVILSFCLCERMFC
jgi:hypothetical protein